MVVHVELCKLMHMHLVESESVIFMDPVHPRSLNTRIAVQFNCMLPHPAFVCILNDNQTRCSHLHCLKLLVAAKYETVSG